MLTAEPSSVLTGFGPLLMQGAIDELAERYQIPCLFEMHGQQKVLDNRAALTGMLTDYARHVRAAGVVEIRSTVTALGDLRQDSAFATAEIAYVDATGTVMNHSNVSYVLNRHGARWQIAVVTIGRSAGGVCDAFIGSTAA